MSKELEALRKIGSLSTQTYTENGISVTLTSQLVKDNCEYKIIEKALTPPTADEVCEAIQRELDYGTVEYVEGNREFMFVNHGEKQNITDCYGDRYKVTGFYKSSTLTLIGRFYEGLGK